jgi:DnaK suppressor protein
MAGKEGAMKTPQHLTDEQMAELHELLLDKRRSLLESVDQLRADLADENEQKGKGGGLSSSPTHPAAISDDTRDREMTMELLVDEDRQLQEVDEAIARMENGTYGFCMGTGEPIKFERLRARPWAKYSLEYAKKVE